MIVRTVLGDIAPETLGPTDAHEHLFLVTPAQPGDEFADVDRSLAEAATLVAAGGRALVDWTPIGLGRDLDGLERIARATGLHIVAATGLHRDPHYATGRPAARPPPWTSSPNASPQELGRCGIVKVGAGYHAVSAFEAKALSAAALAHARVGAPVCVHTEHGTMGLGSSSGCKATACRPRASCWRTSTATRMPGSTPRPPQRARGCSSTARAGRSTGPTRRSWQLIADLAERGHAGPHAARRRHRPRLDDARATAAGPAWTTYSRVSSRDSSASSAATSPSSSSSTTPPSPSRSTPADRAAAAARAIVTSSSDVNGRQRPGSHLLVWHIGHAGGSRRTLMP